MKINLNPADNNSKTALPFKHNKCVTLTLVS